MYFTKDVARGAWLLERAGTFAHVDGVVGGGFAAYARVLHPVTANRVDRDTTDEWGDHPVVETAAWPWSAVAERLGGTVHPLVQWPRLTGVDDESDVPLTDGWLVSAPQQGWFEPALLAVLASHLAASTTTPEDLVAGFWDGWGDLNGSSTLVVGWQIVDEDEEPTQAERAALRAEAELQAAEYRAAQTALVASLAGPRLAWPGRDLVLMTLGLSDLADPTGADPTGADATGADRATLGNHLGVGHTPQLLWPEDRAWAVATEVDWDSTLVAGPRHLVDAVLADRRLEAFEVGEHDDLSWDGDRINRDQRGHTSS